MNLYHGSKLTISKPKHAGSKKDNDYGPAFYLTRDLESAHEWACRSNTVGIVNEYNLDMRGLKVLDLTDRDHYSVLNWLAIHLHYRTLEDSFVRTFKSRLAFIEKHYYIDVSNYDLVIGFRADDAYYRFPLDFVRGNITLEQLEYSYKLGDLGIQHVITSEKGIKHLSFINSFLYEEKYINRYYENTKKATDAFDDLDRDAEGTRIFDIIGDKK